MNGKTEWGGSMSVNLPEQRKYGTDGRELPSDWEALALRQSRDNVVTFEKRGKSILEVAKAFIERSIEEGQASGHHSVGQGLGNLRQPEPNGKLLPTVTSCRLDRHNPT